MQTLIRAMGWGCDERNRKLGYGAVRVMRGGRPRVEMLLRLKALEGAYAEEIAAYKAGWNGVRRGAKIARWSFLVKDEQDRGL